MLTTGGNPGGNTWYSGREKGKRWYDDCEGGVPSERKREQQRASTDRRGYPIPGKGIYSDRRYSQGGVAGTDGGKVLSGGIEKKNRCRSTAAQSTGI